MKCDYSANQVPRVLRNTNTRGTMKPQPPLLVNAFRKMKAAAKKGKK